LLNFAKKNILNCFKRWTPKQPSTLKTVGFQA